ncbi:hypothetical protein [uncultured Winogradskyella sp.]
MANKPNGVIYIGVTDNIDERVKRVYTEIVSESFYSKI